MDKCSTDAEFDSYWDYEAKNKNRNRIRVGRQYQATVPPLLKPGEKDGRRCEDLETLKWKPAQIDDQDVEHYLSMAKAFTSFAKTIDNYPDSETPETSFHTAIKGLAEFVTSHHPCHHDAGCKIPGSSSKPSSSGESPSSSSKCGTSAEEWTQPEAELFTQALESCGKNFCTIKKEFLPWKPVRSLIEYYYYNTKGDKTESASTELQENLPCKLEKTEPSEEGSTEPEKVEPIDAKDEPVTSECIKTEEEELQATPTKEEKQLECNNSKVVTEAVESAVEKPMDAESVPVVSTVGSLKFFLGGRLVLKLNAKQDSGSKCQWVQSNDTPKHLHQSRKMKHRKKAHHESQQSTSDNPNSKKKDNDPDSVPGDDHSSCKKAKMKIVEEDAAYPPLCSASWTPPVADGKEPVEVEDVSSKTSEDCASPVVGGSRSTRTDTPVDTKRRVPELGESVETKYEQKQQSWIKTDASDTSCTSQSEVTYSDHCSSSQNLRFISDKRSPKPFAEDNSNCHEVLNHKSALPTIRTHGKVLHQSRTSHSLSPSAKLLKKWSMSCTDTNPDKAKCMPCTHSPTVSCGSEGSSKADYVLDLSHKSDCCKSQDAGSCKMNCHVYANECTENCSSSEESSHTSCSANNDMLCCKSSNCSAYHRDVFVPIAEPVKFIGESSVQDTNGEGEPGDIESVQRMSFGVREDADDCPCCYNPSTSCASPKCCKSYSSKEQVCNKDDATAKSSEDSSSSMMLPEASDHYFNKSSASWYGTDSSLLQFYPQCYPYYVTYNHPSTLANSSTADIPLDLSSNNSAKEDNSVQGNVPDDPVDATKGSAETLERGVLYQLLKNKATK